MDEQNHSNLCLETANLESRSWASSKNRVSDRVAWQRDSLPCFQEPGFYGKGPSGQ